MFRIFSSSWINLDQSQSVSYTSEGQWFFVSSQNHELRYVDDVEVDVVPSYNLPDCNCKYGIITSSTRRRRRSSSSSSTFNQQQQTSRINFRAALRVHSTKMLVEPGFPTLSPSTITHIPSICFFMRTLNPPLL